MKKIKLIFLISILTFYTQLEGKNVVKDLTKSTYICFDIFKEYDFELSFYEDTTYVLQDKYGCETMYLKGRYAIIDTSKILLTNTSRIQYNERSEPVKMITYDEKNNAYVCSPPFNIDKDTVSITDNNTLEIKSLKFTSSNENVGDLRAIAEANYLIKQMGYKWFSKQYGNDIKKAIKTLRDCLYVIETWW